MNDWELGGEVVCEYSDDEMVEAASGNNVDGVENERYVL